MEPICFSHIFTLLYHLDALLTGQSGNISERSLQRHQQLELGAGLGIILDNLAKDNKDNRKFYLYLYLR